MPKQLVIRDNPCCVKRAGKQAESSEETTADPLYLAQTEIRQLKETVASLRDQLERLEAVRDDAVQHAVAAANDEGRQLHGTIHALRDQLEAALAANSQAAQATRVAHLDEMRQLKATIASLREKLEEGLANAART